MKKTSIVAALLLLVFACDTRTKITETLVSSAEELDKAIANAEPGDHIVLKEGVYKNLQIKFIAQGKEGSPITLKAETPGKVTIEGESSLKLGGDYLVVDGLYFKNGYTPSNAVINFKVNDTLFANHSRVTNCVIEEFTQPSRDTKDHWIEFWGQYNELDHCYIAGKSNQGPTLRVFLKGNQHINNYHQIHHNHFGPRPRKGGPRSETMQIGDSYTSMTPSYVNVSNNYFERCNGEVEIISSKSNFNTFSNNVFFESEGSLVLRHGNYAKIDGNVFIGNDNSEFIGGIRVINTGHWITNNYFYKLKGNEFRAPIAVMNGIPKSPLNRYNQVTDAVIAYNSFIESKTPFHFSVGANLSQAEVLPPSEIRSARPERVIVANNLVYSSANNASLIKAYDKVDGVKFESNILNFKVASEFTSKGLKTKSLALEDGSDIFKKPTNPYETYKGFDFDKIDKDIFGNKRQDAENNIGSIVASPEASILMDKSQYGADWFMPNAGTKKTTEIIVSNVNDFTNAIKSTNGKTKIILKSGDYKVIEELQISQHIELASEDASNKAIINFTSPKTAFRFLPKGRLSLDNVIINGTGEQNTFTTLDKNMSKAYNLFINNTEIQNFKSILEVSKGAFADTIMVRNSNFKNCKAGFRLNKETNDKGDYNAAFVTIKNSTFNAIDEDVLNYYRGGYDESTIGGYLALTGNTFTNSGKTDKDNILLKNRGIVNVKFVDNTFKNNPVKLVAILWGEKGQKDENTTLINSGEIKIVQNLKLKLVY